MKCYFMVILMYFKSLYKRNADHMEGNSENFHCTGIMMFGRSFNMNTGRWGCLCFPHTQSLPCLCILFQLDRLDQEDLNILPLAFYFFKKGFQKCTGCIFF